MKSAFEKYLLSLDRNLAIDHVVDCLMANGEMAWELLEKVNGPGWRCKPKELRNFIDQTLTKLETD